MKKTPPYEIIRDEPAFLAVNKASGISVCPERWTRLDRAGDTGEDTADTKPEQPLIHILEEKTGGRLCICHRLDRETSGVLVFAKTQEMQRRISGLFEKRLVQKTYLAIVHGRPLWEETRCELPLLPDGNKKHHTIVDTFRGKPSATSFRLLFSAGGYSALLAKPETGRTHQIRVHAAALGHPVAGDILYGPTARSGKPDMLFLSSFKHNWRGDRFEERPLLARLALHAQTLVLPFEEGEIVLEAPLPKDFSAALKQLEKNR
jgi:23S rRNA pseudouridine1911/1915/1917 synthase